MTCAACGHVHLGMANCYHSTARDNLCLCKEPQTMESKGNGKDVVDVPAQSLGLRVKSAAVKETEDGGTVATITIVGRAKNLVKLVGEQVNVVSGGRKHHGQMASVTVKAGKDGKREVTAKIGGARDMDSLVGLQVEIEEAEPNLPGVEDRPSKKRGKDAAAGAD